MTWRARVHCARCAYPWVAQLSKLQQAVHLNAELSLSVHIASDGSAQSISVLKSSSDNLQRLVALTLLDTHFVPAKCAGNPCSMEFPFTVKLGQ